MCCRCGLGQSHSGVVSDAIKRCSNTSSKIKLQKDLVCWKDSSSEEIDSNSDD